MMVEPESATISVLPVPAPRLILALVTFAGSSQIADTGVLPLTAATLTGCCARTISPLSNHTTATMSAAAIQRTRLDIAHLKCGIVRHRGHSARIRHVTRTCNLDDRHPKPTGECAAFP